VKNGFRWHAWVGAMPKSGERERERERMWLFFERKSYKTTTGDNGRIPTKSIKEERERELYRGIENVLFHDFLFIFIRLIYKCFEVTKLEEMQEQIFGFLSWFASHCLTSFWLVFDIKDTYRRGGRRWIRNHLVVGPC
jgi:hypothetical protein